jgi:hypothetical protein
MDRFGTPLVPHALKTDYSYLDDANKGTVENGEDGSVLKLVTNLGDREIDYSFTISSDGTNVQSAKVVHKLQKVVSNRIGTSPLPQLIADDKNVYECGTRLLEK